MSQLDIKKILVVEDNQLNQKIAESIINKLGHQVIKLFSGKDVEEVLIKERAHLVILDVILPDISGVEVCRRIKNNPILKDIPVIIVTKLSSEDEKREIISNSACDEYIAKPFFPDFFAKTIAKFIPVKEIDWSSSE